MILLFIVTFTVPQNTKFKHIFFSFHVTQLHNKNLTPLPNGTARGFLFFRLCPACEKKDLISLCPPKKKRNKKEKKKGNCRFFCFAKKKIMPCDDCEVDPCVCGNDDDQGGDDCESQECPSDCEPSCSDSEQDDDCGCESAGDDCERGPQGPQGPPGPAAGVGLDNATSPNFARFYGMTTDEKVGTMIPNGSAVPFPHQNPIVGTSIQRATQTEFLLKRPGSYLVRFLVSTLQAGQLQLEIGNNFDIKRSRNTIAYTPLPSSTATNQNCVSGGLMVVGEDLVDVKGNNSVIRLVNPATNLKSPLQIAGPNNTTLKQPRVHWITIEKKE